MKKLFSYLLSALPLLSLPVLAHAQRPGGIKEWILSVGNIVDMLIVLVAAIALMAFFWGLAKFILQLGNGGGDDVIQEGKQLMFWGIIALFVMVSVWGIVNWIQGELGIPDIENLDAPTLN